MKWAAKYKTRFKVFKGGGKKTLALVFFTIYVVVSASLLAEFLLHFVSFYFDSQRSYRNTVGFEDSKKLRIIALGESTTDEIFASEQSTISWPTQLQEILRQRGIPARVYNLGVTGVSSYFLMQKLQENLDTFQPQIVVSMIGINDNRNYGSYREEKFSSIRLLRLYRMLKYSWQKKLDDFDYEIPELASFVEGLAKDFEEQKVTAEAALSQIKKIEKYTEKEKVGLAIWLIEQLVLKPKKPQSGSEELMKLIELVGLREAISNGYLDVAFYPFQFSKHCARAFRLARGIFEKHKVQFPTEALVSLNHCYENLPDSEKKKAKIFFQTQFNAGNLEEVQNSFRDNYSYLLRVLTERKMTLFAMQYPTVVVGELKNLFTAEQQAKINFISNEENFAEEIKNKGYDSVFIDHFAKHWGHATTRGNALIAQQAANAIEQYLIKNK